MKEKKVNNVEEEDFFDEKPKKKKKEEKTEKEVVYVEKEKSLFSRILNIVLWIILLAWMALVLVDYFKVRDEKDPIFCWFNNHTTTYENGTVTECTGLGYKVIRYNREDFKAIEFGPFWISDRTAEESK
ncbi:MAG: hypothetical protein J6A52_01550 [Bacilli bacterium]|nr:hypothetical protein [Bacilli bacterium]